MLKTGAWGKSVRAVWVARSSVVAVLPKFGVALLAS